MNMKKSLLVCAIFCLVLVFVRWNRNEADQGPPPDSLKEVDAPRTSTLLAETLPPSNTILGEQGNQLQGSVPTNLKVTIQHAYGDGAAKAREAMESFLKTWDPVGRSADELKTTLGKPSIEKPGSITYMFDTGSYAWIFEFTLKNGKVVELNRPLSE